MAKYRVTTEGGTFEVTTDEPSVPGAEKTGLPAAGKAPQLPNELRPDDQQEQSFITSPHGFIRSGLREAMHGVEAMAEPGANAKMGGASKIIRGIGQAAIPAALPLAVMNPVAAAGGIAAGAGIGAGARYGASKLGASPEGQDLAEDVGNVAGGAVAGPAVARGLGRGMQSMAKPLVRAGLSIPAKAAAWGKDPAQFILDKTSSVRPANIAEESEKAVQGLTAEQESAAAKSTTPAHLGPARNVVDAAAAKAAGANSKITPRELAPMQRFLTEPEPGFTGATEYPAGANTPISFKQQPSSVLGPSGAPMPGAPQLVRGNTPPPAVAEEQRPLDLLHMRRQFGTDFVDNWNPTSSTKGALGTARSAYHALGEEADRAIPGGAARDQSISSGIAAKDAAEAASLRATMGQRVLNRISRPTGGLVPMIIGYHEGGPLGAAAGITAAEAAAEPIPLMAGARTLHGVGKATASPLGQTAAQTAPLIRPRKEREGR